MKHWALLLLFCAGCSTKANPDPDTGEDHSSDTGDHASDTGENSDNNSDSDCEQTTGELQVVGRLRDNAGSPDELAGVRVTIADGSDAPFEAILGADGALTIDLSPGDYAVSSSDSSTGRCFVAQAVAATVTECARATATLSFEELLGC